MTTKRLLSAVCALAMAASMISPSVSTTEARLAPAVVASAEVLTCGDFQYTENNGEISITKYTGDGGDVVIPSEIAGKPVTEISLYAFYSCESMTGVTIPETVKEIGYWAFVHCTGLKTIYIPKSVEQIDELAFDACSGLESFVVDEDNKAFNSLDGVIYNKDRTYVLFCPATKTAVNIPDTVTKICSYSFNGCTLLTDIDIPDSVETIENYAFSGCSGLKTVTLPDKVTSISETTFFVCSSLKSINVSSSNTSLSSYDGCIYSKDMSKLIFCPMGKTEIKFAEGLKIIGDEAFGRSENIKNIVIPEGVTEMGRDVFFECKNLEQVTLPETLTELPDFTFDECSSLKEVNIPASVTKIGNMVFANCTSLTSMEIPETVKEVGGGQFYNCTSLRSVKLPSSLTGLNTCYFNLDYSFFGNCTALKELTMPNGAEFQKWTFSGVQLDKLTLTCSSPDAPLVHRGYGEYLPQTKELVVGEGIKEAGTYFYTDAALECVTLPSSMTKIGQGAFGYNLKYIDGDKYDYAYYYNDPFKIRCYDDSAALEYAKENNMAYELIEDTPHHEHSYTSKVTREASCTEPGETTYTCDCGESYTEEIPVKDHSFVDKTVEPTYDEQGYTEHTCSVCGYSFKDNYTPKKQRQSIKSAKVTVSKMVYSGKALKPAVTVKLNGKTLKKGRDYSAAYKNNEKCGKATVTVVGKGAYTGSKSGSFIIKPAKMKAKNLTSPKAKTIKLTWTKAKGGVTGYEVMIATNKKFSKGRKTYTITRAGTTSKTVKDLKNKTKYYAKVRAYKTVNGTKYFGAWSAVKSVKTR